MEETYLLVYFDSRSDIVKSLTPPVSLTSYAFVDEFDLWFSWMNKKPKVCVGIG